MMDVRCYLAPSRIEGLGVCAAEPIAEGSVVWRFNPQFDQVFPVAVMEAQPEHVREFLDRYGYRHHVDQTLWVLDADEGRFMNHSDAPNLVFPEPDIGVARWDVAAGEELTCDYAGFMDGAIVFQPPRHRLAVQETAA